MLIDISLFILNFISRLQISHLRFADDGIFLACSSSLVVKQKQANHCNDCCRHSLPGQIPTCRASHIRRFPGIRSIVDLEVSFRSPFLLVFYEEVPSLTWGEKEWMLYHAFRLNVRRDSVPALKELDIDRYH
jgi:hypothetical protein